MPRVDNNRKTVSGIRVIGKSDAVPFLFLRSERAESLLQCVFLYPADEVVSRLCIKDNSLWMER